MARFVVRVYGGKGAERSYRDLDFLVEARVRWLVLPSRVSNELGIETADASPVVAPSGETVDCEFGTALIETEGRQGRSEERRVGRGRRGVVGRDESRGS